jgi:hypothetical protein
MPSGPRRSASRLESRKSQKSTVTVRRSPSSAARPRRILSARWGGVYARGSASAIPADPASASGTGAAGGAPAGSGGAGAAARRWPHESQKRAPERAAVPHRGQTGASPAPQASQKRAASRLSWPQDAQRMTLPALRGGASISRTLPGCTGAPGWQRSERNDDDRLVPAPAPTRRSPPLPGAPVALAP